jgi:hypothetical protein
VENTETQPQDEDSQSLSAQIFAVIFLVALSIGIVIVVIEILPHHVKNATNPSFIDNIVANPIVIAALRLGLMFGVVYIAVSVVGLIGGRRWLSQLGPLKASDPIRELDKTAEGLKTELSRAIETIEDLEQRLSDSDGALAKARTDIAELLDHLDTMEGKNGEAHAT